MRAPLLRRNLGLAAVLGAIAFTCTPPASAAFGGNHMAAERPLPHFYVHAPAHSGRPVIHYHDLARVRQFNHRPPAGFLPYGIYFDGSSGIDDPVGSDASAGPEVIPLQSPVSPLPATSEPPLDLSYIPGCRPIPNGYHCDAPEHQ